MRLAYIAAQIPLRNELVSSPIDAEWILHHRDAADTTVFVDFESEGSEVLGAAGITVLASPKRPVLFAEGEYETAEQIQARLLLEKHVADPFDAILYDSSITSDWAWYQSRLSAVPRGMVLGPGPLRDLRLITAAPGLYAKHGRALWAMTGALASADFIVGDVPASCYGVADRTLPPRFAVRTLPEATPPSGPAGFVVLVGLSEDPSGLASLVTRMQERVAVEDGAIIAIIHSDLSTGSETTRDIIFDNLRPELRSRIRMAAPSSDGVAAGLLAQADFVVAARPSDLAVPAVADAAEKLGSMVLEGSVEPAPDLLTASLAKRHHSPPVLVPVDRPLGELVPILDDLPDETPSVVLYTPEASALAQRIWKLPGAAAGGLIMVCDTGPYLGEAIPGRPALNILGFGIDSWPSLRRLLVHAGTLHEVVERAASVAHAHRVNLLTLPSAGAGPGRLPLAPADTPAWITDTGLLPIPNLAGVSGPTETNVHAAPAYQHTGPDIGIKRWVETHGFRDRIRLALPWKWGLLNRAMRDRW